MTDPNKTMETTIVNTNGGWIITIREDPKIPGELHLFIQHKEANDDNPVLESYSQGDDGPGWIAGYKIYPENKEP